MPSAPEYSYLKSIQEGSNPVVYQRGLRYYLDGRVGKYVLLALPFWREYAVHGSHEYRVRAPLVHLLLPTGSVLERNAAFDEFCVCTCEYFADTGTCKHVVAVAAALDKEFLTTPIAAEQVSESIGASLDKIFAVEQSKKQQKWYQECEYYLTLPSESDPQHLVLRNLQYTVLDAFANPRVQTEFLSRLSRLVSESFSIWERQRKMMMLLSSERFWLIGQGAWWRFWRPFLHSFDHPFFEKITARLFVISRTNGHVFAEFYDEFTAFLAEASTDQKRVVMEQLLEEGESMATRIEYALSAEHHEFLLEHLDDMNPDFLFATVKILPDEQEKIEYILANQLRTWTDFLDRSLYDDLVKTVSQWRQIIGETPVLEQVLSYIAEHHKKKRRLLSRLAG
jgi:hypothetical protein